MWAKISLWGVLLVSSAAWGETDLLVAVNKHPDKEGAMFSQVGRLVSGRVDWGVPSRIAKAAALDVAYDGGQVAVLTYTDEKEKADVYCRVGLVDEESLTVTWGDSQLAPFKGRNPNVAIRGNTVVCVLRGKAKDILFTVTGTILVDRKQVKWGSTARFGAKGTKVVVD